MVLVALEKIAFSGRTKDVTTGIERLERALQASVTSRPASASQRAFDAHLFARGVFEVCADIVNKGRRERKALEQTIHHRVMTFLASRLNHDGRVPCEFIYKAVAEKTGSGRFDVLGVRVADTRALIAYGFWKAAPRMTLVQWRRYKTLKCRVCKQNFRDLREHLGGAIRTTCDNCRKADRHKNRGRIR